MSQVLPTINLNATFKRIHDARSENTARAGGRLPAVAPAAVVPVASVAVAETAAVIGLLIDRLFGGGRVTDALEEIGDQLDKLLRLLDNVLDTLEDLGVQIAAAFVTDAEVELLSAVDVVADNIAEWEANPGLPRHATQQEVTLSQLQVNSRKVMHYSFASYNTVAYAMPFEAELLTLTSKTSATQRLSLRRYMEYFGNCLNETLPGSVAHTRAMAERVAQEALDQLSRATETIALGLVSWNTSIRCETTAQASGVVTGSPLDGFEFTIVTSNETRTCECLRCSELAVFAVTSARDTAPHNSARDNALTRVRSVMQAHVDRLNAIAAQHREHLIKSEVLRAAEVEVTRFSEASSRLLSALP